MKKIIVLIIVGIFVLSFPFILFAGGKTAAPQEKPKGAKVNVQKVFGEIINIETANITIKQKDGSTITLKVTTPEMQEAIKNFKVGDKVKVLYITKENELILFKIKSFQEKDLNTQTKEKKSNK